jgi:hypothetical protein
MHYAVLRRIARRFPKLDITLVDQTRGYVGLREPLTPAAEADTVRQWWFERDHLPGTLAIANTEFWRLPAPDSRRVNRDTPNKIHFAFGRHWPVQPFSGYVIDRAGTIVDATVIDRWQEERLAALLTAVFAQPTSSR